MRQRPEPAGRRGTGSESDRLLARAVRLAGVSRSVLADGDQRQPKTEREGVGSRKTAVRFFPMRHESMRVAVRWTQQGVTSYSLFEFLANEFHTESTFDSAVQGC